MRTSNTRIDYLKRSAAGAVCVVPDVERRKTGIGRETAAVAIVCLGLLCAGVTNGQGPLGREIQSAERAHSEVCPDPPPQTSGSHVFRKAGETFDIPISVADCQPVAFVLHWSNGRNNGSLLNVTFLDSNNQPIYSRGVSVFQTGILEIPFASPDAQPWFAAAAVFSVPATVVIQAVQPFAYPAGISYTVTRRAARMRSRSRETSQAATQPEASTTIQPISVNLPVLDEQVAMKLRTAEGRLLSQGQGSWGATGESVRYKLKELRLPEPRGMEIHGKRQTVEFAYRLTLSGAESRSSQRAGTTPLPSLSKFGLIWLDDAALPAFSLDSQEISTLIYDPSVLRDGAEIAVSNADGSDMYSLVERLKYQPEGQSLTSNVRTNSEREEGTEVVSIRRAVRVIGASRMPLVQIELRTNRPFPPKDSALQLQIGKRFFLNELTGDPTGRTLTLTLTEEIFAELTEGAAIVAFFNKPDRSGFADREVWHFGRLDKSMQR
jgi:hypothetical protein